MITVETLRELLLYDPETGFLFWKKRDPKWFGGCLRSTNAWNNKHAGSRADRRGNKAGYLRVTIFSVKYYAHRVVWAMNTGNWPDLKAHIDHIDKDKKNNKAENLRCVSASDNHKNTKRQANNRSGQTGVCWVSSKRRWKAYIKTNNKNKHLGYFNTFEEAKQQRISAEQELGFMSGHGGEK